MSFAFISKNLNVCISSKYAVAFGLIASIIHYNVSDQTLWSSDIVAIPLAGIIYFVIALNIQLLSKLCRNIEILNSLKSLRSTTNFSKFLAFGIILHGISTISSSFIEEEHQIWYYINNTVWIILYLIETKHLLKAKSAKNPKPTQLEELSFAENQLKWFLLFGGHLIARRLNQTGDKWLSVPDIGDWLQLEENRTWSSFFASASLLLLYFACMDFGSILTNVLTITACMLIYYYRTLNGSVYFAGIKATG